MTKPRLSEEEHAQIGQQLAEMQRELVRLGGKVANAFPRTGPESLAHKRLTQAEDALRDARWALERELFQDYPDAGTSVYYPQQP
ncbi:hypothetical protein AQJ66_09135 [Streptomyces bungoensis]|uniref:Uncharacterized protein n=1 Tax=Streptomyces bungoensis TaxID=285568 RepID=A0A101T8U5_9ACTN|nr:hypothetical protein [Streptomyces bungoensis]KUN87784.1 hypothetical protein AQJ66_09135 [Streptomyces bungoensis]